MWQTRALAVAWAESERSILEAGRYDDAGPCKIVLQGLGTSWNGSDPVFFSDPMTAAVKALGMM
jgi:hypothetical protein